MLKKELPPKTIQVAISILMLIAGILTLFPYGYYTLLKFVVFGTAAYTAYISFKKESRIIGFLSILVAILFNPFVPIYLNKEAWVIVDVVIILFFWNYNFLFKGRMKKH